jgi:hypothetical protein
MCLPCYPSSWATFHWKDEQRWTDLPFSIPRLSPPYHGCSFCFWTFAVSISELSLYVWDHIPDSSCCNSFPLIPHGARNILCEMEQVISICFCATGSTVNGWCNAVLVNRNGDGHSHLTSELLKQGIIGGQALTDLVDITMWLWEHKWHLAFGPVYNHTISPTRSKEKTHKKGRT